MIGAVIAGGKSLRMGFPKAFVEIEGKRIIGYAVDALKSCLDKVVISANEPDAYSYLKVPVISDICKDSGPMGGIHSVLVSTGEPEIFVAACDMPFIKPELVRYISGIKGRDATVPVFGGRPEPLLAVYAKNAIRYMESAIMGKMTSLREMMEGLDVLYIEESDLRKIDPEGRSFININTVEDLNIVFKEIKGGRPCLV